MKILSAAFSLSLTTCSAWSATVGVWNFNKAENGVIKNELKDSPVHAHLKGFDPQVLAGTDVQTAPFLISRSYPVAYQATLDLAKSGWSTFQGIKDNGLENGVATPVGTQALCLYSAKNGNWIHFPGLATAMVDRPKGAARSFGISIWMMLQSDSEEQPKYIFKKGANPIIRFGKQDMRIMTYNTMDRFYTEDVGNGLGGAKSYKTTYANRQSTAGKWFNLVVTADKEAQTFRMFINNQELEYAHNKNAKEPYAWPLKGGMQINYELNHLSDGAVIGRWLGGHAANNTTMAFASVVIVRDEVLDDAKRRLLYQLGRKGIPFTGDWDSGAE